MHQAASKQQIMKSLFILPVSLLLTLTLAAQPAGVPRNGGFGGSQTGRMYGKVVDSLSGKGIDAVSVQLVSTKFDMARRQRKDTILTGMLTPANGNFSLENIPLMGDYTIRISAIGYKTLNKKVSFLTPEMQKKLIWCSSPVIMTGKGRLLLIICGMQFKLKRGILQ